MDEEGVSRSLANSTPVRHDLLWFLDGNVVLATDSLLFRVHKSFLSLHSSVFKDMFDLPFVAPGDVEDQNTAEVAYEGLPLVALAGDKGEDVAHLLRAAYERG